MGIISFFKSLFSKKEVIKAEKLEVSKEIKSEEVKVEVIEEKITAKEIKSTIKQTKSKKEPKFKASKAAIKLAKENGIDLTKVSGTGKEGSITVNDVQKLIK
jgi:pyruvate/2-oxoglutarate dehydrogenase complex dihydrolipoamide acyltransferase (E2) component